MSEAKEKVCIVFYFRTTITLIQHCFDRLNHGMPAGGGYRLCLRQKVNHHENAAEHPSIEKYLRTLMAKKLHGALLVPQKNFRKFYIQIK